MVSNDRQRLNGFNSIFLCSASGVVRFNNRLMDRGLCCRSAISCHSDPIVVSDVIRVDDVIVCCLLGSNGSSGPS